MKVTNIRKPKTRDYEPQREALHIYRSLLIKLQADKRIGEKRQK